MIKKKKKKEHAIVPGPAVVHFGTLPLMLAKKNPSKPKKAEADSASTNVPQLRKESNRTKTKTVSNFKELSSQPLKNHSFETVLIQEGLGNFKDCFFYTKQALQGAVNAQLFEGIHCFADHPSEVEEQILPERSTRDILGYYENVVYRESEDGTGQLASNLSVRTTEATDWAMSLLTNAIDYSKKFKESDLVGLSINASGSSEPADIDEFMASNQLSQTVIDKLLEAKKEGVTTINVVNAFTSAKSVDLVTAAGAGGKILKMLEMEKAMAKKIKESEHKHEAGFPPKPGMPPAPGAAAPAQHAAPPVAPVSAGTPDHADAAQDQELFAKMIQQYMGKDQPDAEEMEAAKNAYEAHRETGMEHNEAYEAAGKHLKMAMAIGKKMSQAHEAENESESESEHESETEESENEESESESHHEATDAPPAKPGKKGTPSPTGDSMEKKKEAMAVIKLSGEVATLRESLKRYELRDHLDKKLKESGKSNAFTKKFREALGVPKSVGQIDEMWRIFLSAADAGAEEVGGSEEGFMTEKNGYRESNGSALNGKFDVSDCLR